MPALIDVQQTARRLLDAKDRDPSQKITFAECVDRDAFLRQHATLLNNAFDLRQVVVILDGLDEAGEAMHKAFLDFLMHTLLPAGFRVLVTCRPETLGRAALARAGCSIVNLLPLSAD